jgi:XTP/dITP diphosphohydrolase
MPTLDIRFVTSNARKVEEATAILGREGITVIPATVKIEEIQTTDPQRLLHDKLLKAFARIGRPLFVEHTGLYLEHLQGLPGGLTQIFWDSLEADRFAELFGMLCPNKRVTVRTFIAYCDGRTITDFTGEIAGQIVPKPRGDRRFNWDCVFQPDGYTQTFAEMGAAKDEISMRRIALGALAKHLLAPAARAHE